MLQCLSSEFEFAAARISTTRKTFVVFFSLVFFFTAPSNCRFAVAAILLLVSAVTCFEIARNYCRAKTDGLSETCFESGARRWNLNFFSTENLSRNADHLRPAKFYDRALVFFSCFTHHNSAQHLRRNHKSRSTLLLWVLMAKTFARS